MLVLRSRFYIFDECRLFLNSQCVTFRLFIITCCFALIQHTLCQIFSDIIIINRCLEHLMKDCMNTFNRIKCQSIVINQFIVKPQYIWLLQCLYPSISKTVFDILLIHINVIAPSRLFQSFLVILPQFKYIINCYILLSDTNTITHILINFIFLFSKSIKWRVIYRVPLSISCSPTIHVQSIRLSVRLTIL